MSAEDKVQAALKRKELGNKFFKAQKWSRAAKKYKAAGDIIDHDVSDMPPTSPVYSDEFHKEVALSNNVSLLTSYLGIL